LFKEEKNMKKEYKTFEQIKVEGLQCPSDKKCPFKRFSLTKGMECTMLEVPEHLSVFCAERWRINVLKEKVTK